MTSSVPREVEALLDQLKDALTSRNDTDGRGCMQTLTQTLADDIPDDEFGIKAFVRKSSF
jgi:hypothetical protein